MNRIEELKKIIRPEVEDFGAELLDINLRGKPGTFRLSVIVDTETGITIDECTKITRRLNMLPEINQVLDDRYQLEVSSPGTNYPLKSQREFQLKIGKEIQVTIMKDGNVKKVSGKLVQVLPDKIILNTKSGEMQVQYEQVKKAVQALPW